MSERNVMLREPHIGDGFQYLTSITKAKKVHFLSQYISLYCDTRGLVRQKANSAKKRYLFSGRSLP